MLIVASLIVIVALIIPPGAARSLLSLRGAAVGPAPISSTISAKYALDPIPAPDNTKISYYLREGGMYGSMKM
jgi:hypothetical protein